MPSEEPSFSQGDKVVYVGPDVDYDGEVCTITRTGLGTEFGSPAYNVEFEDGETMSHVSEKHLESR